MIRFRFKGNNRHPAPILFIGLSHNNLDALKRGKPIRIHRGDQLELDTELVIYAGRTEEEMTAELETHGFVPEGSTGKVAKAQKARREIRLRTAPDEALE
jgi:hypothetical protein